MSKRKITYIYALVDPRDNQVRYVGKSDNPHQRLSAHCQYKAAPTSHKSKWICELRRAGLRPEIKILEEIRVSDWLSAEKRWIRHYITQGNNLVNGNKGGAGYDADDHKLKKFDYRDNTISFSQQWCKFHKS